jgi:parvulin-like peptidyl-prolyl isomerase
MKKILTLLAFVLLASAQAAPIQVTLQMPAGLQVGKNQIVAQVQADSSYNGTPVSVALDPGNNQAVQEVLLGKIGDPSLQGTVELTSLNASPSLTVKVTKPTARYADTQVVALTATSAQFVLDAPRSRNANHGLIVLASLLAFGALGAIALRGEKTAF